jgi:imidazoleglycerol-phosphate dehydratase
MKKRQVVIKRKTRETKVTLKFTADGAGGGRIDTGLPFFDHMLHQFAFHGGFNLELKATGDLEVDPHHLVEDLGLVLGEAINRILKISQNVTRYGDAVVPMDEALVLVAVDLGGRPYLNYPLPFKRQVKVGRLEVGIFQDFWRSVVNKGLFNLHFLFLEKDDPHHLLEASFKAFGLALSKALVLKTGRRVSSTKGWLV